MKIILQILIDFIFPPNKEEIFIRKMSPKWLIDNAIKAEEAEFDFIKALFSYKDSIVREVIWQIKYKKNKKAMECGSIALFESIKNTNHSAPILLIPIPISKERRRERGYNQCELLIDKIIEFDKSGMLKKDFNLLSRIKDVEKQTHKNRLERISNLKKVFNIESKKDFNKKEQIIIIDDVTTTGSTLKEARDELLLAGYLNVKALTIAH